MIWCLHGYDVALTWLWCGRWEWYYSLRVEKITSKMLRGVFKRPCSLSTKVSYSTKSRVFFMYSLFCFLLFSCNNSDSLGMRRKFFFFDTWSASVYSCKYFTLRNKKIVFTKKKKRNCFHQWDPNALIIIFKY